jgi:hypothetical protein
VRWCAETDVQHGLFDRMVNGKSGEFSGSASIIPVYYYKGENCLFFLLKGRKLVNVVS